MPCNTYEKSCTKVHVVLDINMCVTYLVQPTTKSIIIESLGIIITRSIWIFIVICFYSLSAKITVIYKTFNILFYIKRYSSKEKFYVFFKSFKSQKQVLSNYFFKSFLIQTMRFLIIYNSLLQQVAFIIVNILRN